MQVNEHAGQVRQGNRRPDIDRAFNDTHAKPETRAKRLGADEPRRTTARPPTRRTVSYGAGF